MSFEADDGVITRVEEGGGVAWRWVPSTACQDARRLLEALAGVLLMEEAAVATPGGRGGQLRVSVLLSALAGG